MALFPADSFLLKQIKSKALSSGLFFFAVGCGSAVVSYFCIKDAIDGSQWVGLLFIFFAAVCIWQLYRVVDQSLHPEKHPLIKAIAQFGPAEQIISKIEDEIKNPEIKFSNCVVTKSWCIGSPMMGPPQIAFIPEIVWAHKKTMSNNGVKSHSAVIYRRNGTFFETSGKDKECMALLESISKKAPSAIMGYSPEIKKLWDSDRASFLQQVDKRKRDVGLQV